jgi:uncharacterized protein (TIGR03435 family)
MLQDLLADRFKLVIRRERARPAASSCRSARDKHKLKEAAGPGAGCQGTPPPQPPPVPMTIGACKGVTMDQFAVLLRQIAGGYINAPVQNQTGLRATGISTWPSPRSARCSAPGLTPSQSSR